MAELHMHEPRTDYANVVRWVRDLGAPIQVRDLLTRELTGVTLLVPDVTQPVLPLGVGRKVNTRFAAVDALGLISGSHRGELLDVASPKWRSVLVDPSRAHEGAYGPRTRGQFDFIVRQLQQDPTTRRAVATIWQPSDLYTDGDRPCTLTLQFLLRNDTLHLHTSMRSQDVWLGLAYDLFTFTQLQLTIARWLAVTPGALIHHVGSFHLYERDLEKVDNLLTEPWSESKAHLALPMGVWSPRLPQLTPPFTAFDILLNQVDPETAAANPWYVEQVSTIYAEMVHA